jgi:hypothetical protein
MKNFVGNLFVGGNAKFNVLLVLCAFALVGLGCFGAGRNKDDNPSPTPATSPAKDNSNKSDNKKSDDNDNKKEITKKANAAKWEVPEDDEMKEMARTALMDFNEAVQDGDFAEFHTKISKTWQKQTTPEKFNQAFSEFIAKKVDISNISSAEPQYSPDPEVKQDLGAKKLIAKGCYDVSPRPVGFTLKWIPEGKEWKLFGIEVDTTIPSC